MLLFKLSRTSALRHPWPQLFSSVWAGGLAFFKHHFSVVTFVLREQPHKTNVVHGPQTLWIFRYRHDLKIKMNPTMATVNRNVPCQTYLGMAWCGSIWLQFLDPPKPLAWMKSSSFEWRKYSKKHQLAHRIAVVVMRPWWNWASWMNAVIGPHGQQMGFCLPWRMSSKVTAYNIYIYIHTYIYSWVKPFSPESLPPKWHMAGLRLSYFLFQFQPDKLTYPMVRWAFCIFLLIDPVDRKWIKGWKSTKKTSVSIGCSCRIVNTTEHLHETNEHLTNDGRKTAFLLLLFGIFFILTYWLDQFGLPAWWFFDSFSTTPSAIP